MNTQTHSPLAHVYGCSCRNCRRVRYQYTRGKRRRSRGSHWWNETDGRRPRGDVPGMLTLRWHPHMGMTSYRDGRGKLIEFHVPTIADLFAWRDFERPWLLEVWEPLPIKAPGPHAVRPHCCYINTVVFYVRPYQTLPPKRYLSWHEITQRADGRYDTRRLERPTIRRDSTGSFAEYGRVETRFQWGVLLDFSGDTFEKVGGTVIWSRPHWWMRYRFRRVKPGDRLHHGGVFNP